MPTFIDLFSGAGGLSLGFKRAGWTSLLAVDVWADALQTYSRNFSPETLKRSGEQSLLERGRHTLLADLSEKGTLPKVVQALDERPDWVIGGPPCKGFSTVGRRNRDDPRNRLVENYADIVEALSPRGFLIENVLGMRDMKFIDAVVQRFTDLGYRVTPAVLRAASYGVPQLRRRVVFVGTRDGLAFKKPAATHSSEEERTVWDAIGDLPPLLPGEQATAYATEATTAYQREMRRGSTSIQGHRASKHPQRLVKAISFIPDGGNRKDIPDELQPKSGFHNSYSRLNSREPAVAVTQNMGKPSATRCIHPFQDRGLTAREGARLQSFPDWFHFTGGMVSQREQIANAVPPILGQAVAEALLSDCCWTESPTEAEHWNGMTADGSLIRPLDARSIVGEQTSLPWASGQVRSGRAG